MYLVPAILGNYYTWNEDAVWSLQQLQKLAASTIVPILWKRKQRHRQVKIAWSSQPDRTMHSMKAYLSQEPHCFPEYLPQDKVCIHFTNNNKDLSQSCRWREHGPFAKNLSVLFWNDLQNCHLEFVFDFTQKYWHTCCYDKAKQPSCVVFHESRN